MPGTEKAWVRKLNKRKPLVDIYNFGSSNPYVGGIPDRYYEASKRSVWIEFKHILRPTHMFDARKAITEAQREWLTRNWENGNHPQVIVGVALSHGFILDVPEDWNHKWEPAIHQRMHQPIDEIAEYIRRFVDGTR
jgi:hypothetical protein